MDISIICLTKYSSTVRISYWSYIRKKERKTVGHKSSKAKDEESKSTKPAPKKAGDESSNTKDEASDKPWWFAS